MNGIRRVKKTWEDIYVIQSLVMEMVLSLPFAMMS